MSRFMLSLFSIFNETSNNFFATPFYVLCNETSGWVDLPQVYFVNDKKFSDRLITDDEIDLGQIYWKGY